MDNRRWDTQQVLDGGILNLPIPASQCPADAALISVDEESMGVETLRAGLESGGLKALMYYGCWVIWRTESGFDGELMQYRRVTDQFTNSTLSAALEKAQEWGTACYG